MPRMLLRWHEVTSSTIRSIAYSGSRRELWIAFKSGSVYRYSDVPLWVMGAMMRSRSKGSAHHRLIRGRYDFRRVK